MTTSSVVGGNRVLAKIRKLIGAAPHPAFWRVMANGVMTTFELFSILFGISPRNVIDIGANEGRALGLVSTVIPNAAVLQRREAG